jgi:hypothetical protein
VVQGRKIDADQIRKALPVSDVFQSTLDSAREGIATVAFSQVLYWWAHRALHDLGALLSPLHGRA